MTITDLDALEKACRTLGCQFIRNQTSVVHYGGSIFNCLHAISIPGTTWGIGINKIPNKAGFDLGYDNFGSNGRVIEGLLGKNLSRLKQRYTLEALKNKAGKKVKIKEEMNGNVLKLTLTVG